MPFTNLNLITVTGKYLLLNGSSATGSVSFTADQTLIDSVANEIVVPVEITANLVAGVLAVELPATDDPDLSPVGWTYTVVESISNAKTKRTYQIQIPHDAPGATIDLADVAPVVELDPVSPYILTNRFLTHVIGTSDKHSAAGINFVPGGSLVALTVQAVIEELNAKKFSNDGSLTADSVRLWIGPDYIDEKMALYGYSTEAKLTIVNQSNGSEIQPDLLRVVVSDQDVISFRINGAGHMICTRSLQIHGESRRVCDIHTRVNGVPDILDDWMLYVRSDETPVCPVAVFGANLGGVGDEYKAQPVVAVADTSSYITGAWYGSGVMAVGVGWDETHVWMKDTTRQVVIPNARHYGAMDNTVPGVPKSLIGLDAANQIIIGADANVIRNNGRVCINTDPISASGLAALHIVPFTNGHYGIRIDQPASPATPMIAFRSTSGTNLLAAFRSDAKFLTATAGITNLTDVGPDLVFGTTSATFSARATNHVPLASRAIASQAVDIFQATGPSGAPIFFRIGKDGRPGFRVNTAPADADVATSEGMLWWSNTVGGSGVQLKGKDSAGTVVLQDFSKGTAVTAPAGGATIDAEARTAIGQIIAHLQRMGVAA